MKNVLFLMLILLIIVAGGYFIYGSIKGTPSDPEKYTELTQIPDDELRAVSGINPDANIPGLSDGPQKAPGLNVVEKNTKLTTTPEDQHEYKAVLEDVTGGTATGEASASFGEAYSLLATFENLPEAGEGYFYEGWVVKKSPLDVISTGKVQVQGERTINRYYSDQNLTDHDFYVLTLEPDDNDPAPAKHILEGTLTK